jgi:2-dehydropantoate 2-reductase
MKICIFGAGAIGGYMARQARQGGADVSVVARGPHLARRCRRTASPSSRKERVAPSRAASDPADLGPQDYVIITLKAHSVPPIVGRQMQAADRAGDHHRHRRERRALVVLPRARRPARRARLEASIPAARQWDG